MELEVPKRPNLGLIQYHGSASFVVREAKEVLSLQMSRTMVEKHCFDQFFIFIFIFIFAKHLRTYKERREEDWEKVKHEEISQNCSFWTYIKKS